MPQERQIDWSETTLGDLKEDPRVQTMPLDRKEKLYTSFFDFHKIEGQDRENFSSLYRLDHLANTSDGFRKSKFQSDADAFRGFIEATRGQSAQSIEPAQQALMRQFDQNNKDYQDALDVRGKALQAALRYKQILDLAGGVTEKRLGFDVTSKAAVRLVNAGPASEQSDPSLLEKAFKFIPGPQAAAEQPVDKDLLTARDTVLSELSAAGVENPVSVVDGKVVFSDQMKSLVEDAEKINAFDGDSVIRSSEGEWVVRPKAILEDFAKAKKDVERLVPPVEARAILEQIDERRAILVGKFTRRLEDAGEAEGLYKRIDEEVRAVGLDPRNPPPPFVPGPDSIKTRKQRLYEKAQLKAKSDFIADFIQEENNRGTVSTFFNETLPAFGRGFTEENPLVTVVNLAEGGLGIRTTAGDEIRRRKAARQAIDPISNTGGEGTKVAAAVANELPSVLFTLGIGKATDVTFRSLNLSAKNSARLARWATSGYQGARSGAGTINELIASDADDDAILQAGFTSFATTMLVTQVFNKMGVGGIEQYRAATPSLVAALKPSFKAKVAEAFKIIGKGVSGEAIEEATDTMLNSLITNAEKHWTEQKTPEQIVEESIFAAKVGGLIGGGHASVQASSDLSSRSTLSAVLSTGSITPEEKAELEAASQLTGSARKTVEDDLARDIHTRRQREADVEQARRDIIQSKRSGDTKAGLDARRRLEELLPKPDPNASDAKLASDADEASAALGADTDPAVQQDPNDRLAEVSRMLEDPSIPDEQKADLRSEQRRLLGDFDTVQEVDIEITKLENTPDLDENGQVELSRLRIIRDDLANPDNNNADPEEVSDTASVDEAVAGAEVAEDAVENPDAVDQQDVAKQESDDLVKSVTGEQTREQQTQQSDSTSPLPDNEIRDAVDSYFGGTAPDNVVIEDLGTDGPIANVRTRPDDPTFAEIRINSSRATSPETVQSSIDHEVAHLAFDDPSLREAFMDVWDHLTDEDKTDTLKQLQPNYSSSKMFEESKVVAVERINALFKSEQADKGRFRKLMDSIREFLRKLFGGSETADQRIQRRIDEILTLGVQRLQQGSGRLFDPSRIAQPRTDPDADTVTREQLVDNGADIDQDTSEDQIPLARFKGRNFYKATTAQATGVAGSSLNSAAAKAAKPLSKNKASKAIARALKAANELNPLKQIQQDLKNKEYLPVFTTWMHQRSMARPMANYAVEQLKAKYINEVLVDDKGQLTSKDNEDGTFRGVRPLNPNQSMHISDVITALQQDPFAYQASDGFLEFVAESRRMIQELNDMAISEGINLGWLKNEKGEYDYETVDSNFYFPRGQVTLAEDPEVSGATGGGSGRITARLRTSNKRRFKTEEDGVKNGFLYNSDPFKRMEDHMIDYYTRIADWRLASDSDLRSLSLEKGKKAAKNFADPVTGEVGQSMDRKNLGAPLGTGYVDVGSYKLLIDDESRTEINRIIKGQLQESEGFSRAVSRLNRLRRLKFTGDFSALLIQNAILGGSHPIRAAKVAAASFRSFDPRSKKGEEAILRRIRSNRAYIKEAVEHGLLHGRSIDAIESALKTNERKSIFKKFDDFHGIAMSFGALELYKARRYQGLNDDGTVNPEKMVEVARFADGATGRSDLSRYGWSKDGQNIMQAASAAPSMYVAFGNLIADMTSPNATRRSLAIRGFSRFLIGSHMIFFGLAMAAAAREDDNKSILDNASDVARRMLPGDKNYMSIPVTIGSGKDSRQVILGFGGFFRSVSNFLGKSLRDPSKTTDFAQQFLKSRKSPGVSTIAEILSDEDFFGNPITNVEASLDAITPVSLTPIQQRLREPLLNWMDELTGTRMLSRDELEKNDPRFTMTLAEAALSTLGANVYIESDARRFKRNLDSISRSQFNKGYEDITPSQKATVTIAAAEQGHFKPKWKGNFAHVREFIEREFDHDMPRKASNQLRQRGIFSVAAGVPRRSVKFPSGTMVLIGDSEFKEIRQEYIDQATKMIEENPDMSSPRMTKQLRMIYHRILTSRRYPSSPPR